MARRCTACGYDLAGIPPAATVCPECATRLDAMPPEGDRLGKALAWACGPALIAYAAACVCFLAGSSGVVAGIDSAGLLLGGLLMLAAVVLGLAAPPLASAKMRNWGENKPEAVLALSIFCLGSWLLIGFGCFLLSLAFRSICPWGC